MALGFIAALLANAPPAPAFALRASGLEENRARDEVAEQLQGSAPRPRAGLEESREDWEEPRGGARADSWNPWKRTVTAEIKTWLAEHANPSMVTAEELRAATAQFQAAPAALIPSIMQELGYTLTTRPGAEASHSSAVWQRRSGLEELPRFSPERMFRLIEALQEAAVSGATWASLHQAAAASDGAPALSQAQLIAWLRGPTPSPMAEETPILPNTLTEMQGLLSAARLITTRVSYNTDDLPFADWANQFHLSPAALRAFGPRTVGLLELPTPPTAARAGLEDVEQAIRRFEQAYAAFVIAMDDQHYGAREQDNAQNTLEAAMEAVRNLARPDRSTKIDAALRAHQKRLEEFRKARAQWQSSVYNSATMGYIEHATQAFEDKELGPARAALARHLQSTTAGAEGREETAAPVDAMEAIRSSLTSHTSSPISVQRAWTEDPRAHVHRVTRLSFDPGPGRPWHLYWDQGQGPSMLTEQYHRLYGYTARVTYDSMTSKELIDLVEQADRVTCDAARQAGAEEGIRFYASLKDAEAADPEVVTIIQGLGDQAQFLQGAMLAIPTDEDVTIYATPEAMSHPQVAALQAEAANTAGFERLTIQEWKTGKVLPQNAILLIGEERTWVLRRGDIVRVPVESATSLNALLSKIFHAKLGHEIGLLVIRRSKDLRTTYIFA